MSAPVAGRRAIAVVVVVLAALGLGTVAAYFGTRTSPCGAERVSGGSPLLSVAGMAEQPDPRLARLTRAVSSWGAPFGPVRAGAGFDYGQWLHLYGVANGMLAFTKNNADITLLGDVPTPRWTLRPLHRRVAWDASADRFLLLGLTAGQPTVVSSYGLLDGRQRWCVRLPSAQADGQPVATAFLDGDDALVALPGRRGIEVARLTDSGRIRWRRDLTGSGRADYLGPLIAGVFVAGGVEEYRLAQNAPTAPAGPAVSAYSAIDGSRVWSWDNAAGMQTHVVGVDGEHPVLLTRSADGALRLRALDATGAELWEVAPFGGAVESTLRDGVVIMRSRTRLDAYDAGTGRPLWHRPIPVSRTYFPYGFTLDQMPSLDAGHLLMPTTTSLEVLDVRTGRSRSFPLPVDGINTTYWPYQLAVTDHLIGVVTNTGGVVAGREALSR